MNLIIKMKYSRVVFSLFLSVFSLTSSIAQSNCDCYQRLYELSDYYLKIGKAQKSLDAFQAALNYRPNYKPYDHYYLSKLYAANEECEKSKNQLRLALVKGQRTDYLAYDQNFPKCFEVSGEKWE